MPLSGRQAQGKLRLRSTPCAFWRDREASALVAVDTADDEQLLGAARIAKFERVDATIFDRTPDQQGERMRARGQGKQQRGQCRDGGLHDRSGSSSVAE